jgi:hypothetical protein
MSLNGDILAKVSGDCNLKSAFILMFYRCI